MFYRRFGKTELQMPVFSCGGMRFQHKWEDLPWQKVPQKNQSNLEAIIHRALELGINHFETARGYGTSEMQLGKILPKLPRDKLIIQTKVPPQKTEREFFDVFNKSLDYLGLDYVDLLGVHGLNNNELFDWTFRKGGALETARKIQREGRCRFIGFSTHGHTDLILKIIRTGEFDYINLHWYYFYQFNWSAIEEAHKQDMGVFIISPNDKGGKLYQPPEKLVELCHPMHPMQFNALFCLSRPEVHTLSTGAAKPEDFNIHIQGIKDYPDFKKAIDPIAERLKQVQIDAVGAEWTNNWWKGLPRFDEIPGEINVFEILRFWTLLKSYDMIDYCKTRYEMFGKGGHWFPGANGSQADQLNWTKHLKKNPFAKKIPEIIRETHQLLTKK